MESKAKAFTSKSLWLALVLVIISSFRFSVFGDAVPSDKNQPDNKTIPPSSYELRFLGAKLNKATGYKTHTGVFVFTWKGQNPIQVLTRPQTDKEVFYPDDDFRVYNEESGWLVAGGLEDPMKWTTIQPGQVITFSIGMGIIDVSLDRVKKGDKACLVLHSKEGELVSDEFPLPLLPPIPAVSK